MNKRNSFLTVIGCVLVAVIMITTPVLAGDFKAKNLDELAQIVNEQGVARNKDFTVTFSGTDAEWDYLMEDYFRLYYYDLVKNDDPNTSDDADYLFGNIDPSKESLTVTSNDDLRFRITYFETKDQSQYVNEIVPQILDELGVASMSNYDKVKTIYDYVCKLIKYKNDVKNCSSAYSAFKNGTGLCNSYALCMCKLLTEAGVPCKFIGGTAGTGRDADGHAWNIVMLGNKWYYLDATWDDAGNKATYDYFLKGTSDFDEADPSQKHKLDEEYTTTDYLKSFPISKKKFAKGSNDKNNIDTGNSSSNNSENNTNTENTGKTYTYKKIVDFSFPTNGKLSIKKGRKDSIMLLLNDTGAAAVTDVSYKIISGKQFIKVLDSDIYDDVDGTFTDTYIKGVKKGTAKVNIILKMDNGQKIAKTFTVKVK